MNPLVFFVHVGKTAGTTVNRILASEEPNGIDHCEAIIQNSEKLRDAANNCRWLSGHVDLDRAKRALSAATKREVRFFTCLRDPNAQVISHYNWLIEIFFKGEDFYNNHGAVVREISSTIRASDNSDPNCIIHNLSKYSNLFLNYQQGLVLGREFNWNKGKIYDRLREYEYIGNPNDINKLVSLMVDREVKVKKRENVSKYHFDKDVFKTPQLKRFLNERNVLDRLLFEIAKDHMEANYKKQNSLSFLKLRAQ